MNIVLLYIQLFIDCIFLTRLFSQDFLVCSSLEKEMATLSSSSMLLHCLLSSMVFDEKLAVNLTEDPYMWYITFTFFQNPLSLFLLVVDFAVARCGFFFSQFILLEVFWAPGMCRLIFYIKFGKFGATYFFK